MSARKLISIVTPCYNEQENVRAHYDRVSAAIAPLRGAYDFELIYTDNCSTDRTWELLTGLAAADKNVRALRFARNVGPNRAMILGLFEARGDAAILVQGDLQDPPELIPDFVRGWEEGYDVVYGRILSRDEGAVMAALRRLYYRLIAALSDVPPPRNALEFRLTTRRVLDALREYREDDIYIRGAIAHIGFAQKEVPYERAARHGGRSSLNLLSLIGYAINGFLSTTVAPIRAVVVFGFLLAAFGFSLTTVLAAVKIFHLATAPRGITMLATLITFFAGAQLLAIGIIGEYIRKIYVQALQLPRGFVKDRVNFP